MACATFCSPAVADTATAAVPRHLIGMNVDGITLSPGIHLGYHLRAIREAGAGSVRWSIDWAALQPHRSWSEVPAGRRDDFTDVDGAPIDFRATDRLVAQASRARLRLLPVVNTAAPWASENAFAPFAPPADIAAFGRFAGVLAERYGSRGAFWKQHPDLPSLPLRTWQIWNEPAGLEGFGSPSIFWQSERDPLPTYMEMLAAARSELRKADPRSQVVLSGLFGRSWVSLEQLYRAGARPLFDAVAIHPYTRYPRNVVRIVENVRRVMARWGDARKPMVLTEVSWPSDGRKGYSDFSVTRAQQATLLTRTYTRLLRARARLKLRGVFWYTWMSAERSTYLWSDYAGIVTPAGNRRFSRKPAYFAFRKMAHRLTRGG